MLGDATWYAIAVIVTALIGVIVWAVLRSAGSAEARVERDILQESQGHQDEAEKVLAEPAPTGWREILARRAARRKRRLRYGDPG